MDYVSQLCFPAYMATAGLGEAWIPLFASAGNFVWTAYLSGVSASPIHTHPTHWAVTRGPRGETRT